MICTGLSATLVTWHWLAGCLRARSFVTAIIISSTLMLPTTSVSFAGVMAVVSGMISVRGTLMSHSMRATWRESMAMAFSASSRLMP